MSEISSSFRDKKNYTAGMKTPRLLFVCHKLTDSYGIPVGLMLSASFTACGLTEAGYTTRVVTVVDSNCIDREIALYRPTHVLIEAIWVPPAKLQELVKLHPSVIFLIHVHSKTPFLANEGIALKWIMEYKNVTLAANSISLKTDLNFLGLTCVYLPNIYCPEQNIIAGRTPDTKGVHIGCFGAIRPMKNTLIQAIASIAYANHIGKTLWFHVNASRVEQHGSEPLKNLRALANGGKIRLIEHPWMSHVDFIHIVSLMDLGLQVSLSESFNIVTADFVYAGVPIVVSPDSVSA